MWRELQPVPELYFLIQKCTARPPTTMKERQGMEISVKLSTNTSTTPNPKHLPKSHLYNQDNLKQYRTTPKAYAIIMKNWNA